MAKQWTRAQLSAIESTEGSVLVSAAAGSGKTAVLVARVMGMIARSDNPVDVDRLLIVTFTRSAAAEMRQRLSEELTKMLSQDPYNPLLLRQKRLLYNAQICTIDSFCGSIVREYFHCLEISRDFRIADEGELKILRGRALDETFEKYYSEGGAEFAALADAFSSKNGDENLRGTVLKISEFLSTCPFPEKWMNDMLGRHLVTSAADSIWGRLIIENSETAVNHAVSLTKASAELVSKDKKLADSFLPRLGDDLAFLNVLRSKLESAQWDDIADFAGSFSAGRLTAPRGYKDNPLKLAAAANRDEVKSTIKKISGYFSRSESEVLYEIKELYGLVSTLFDLTRSYLAFLSKLESGRNLLSFSDVELFAVKLLARPTDGGFERTPQGDEISSRFDAVMVDEFQDVNEVQDLIFRCVSRNEENLFAVGDVKQSIYGFRQAKPEIFLSRRNTYSRFDENAPEYPAYIILDKNFRSRREICSAVNFIFSRLMTKQTSAMDYDSDEALNAGAQYPESGECRFELAMLDKTSLEAENGAEAEACCIAVKIRKMMSEGFTVSDGGKMRRAEYGDFAVIMRSPSGVAEKYVSTLNKFGIPAYSDSRDNSFESPEIKVILNLLRVINNPTLDIPLLSVMCSPVFGFSPDELAHIRAENKSSSLYASVREYARTDKKTSDFLGELDVMGRYACSCSVDELLGRIYERTALPSVLSAAKGSKEAGRSLNMLREYARGFAKNGCKTLSDFIDFTDRLIENGTGLPSVSKTSGAINGVRVLSIHASKGLEFPVCFIADTARRFNKSDLSEDILLDSRAGLGIRRREGVCRYNTLPRIAVGMEISRAEVAEELRVLYVALTRAKEKLIVVSSHKDVGKYLSGVYSKLVSGRAIEPYTVIGSGCICDWITMCALVHPSMAALRERAGAGALPFEGRETDVYPWSFEEVTAFDASLPDESGKAPADDSRGSAGDEKYALLLKKAMEFEYPNKRIMGLPQKMSASEIVRRDGGGFDRVLARPAFVKSGGLSATERGTAHHRFLQYCDFRKARESVLEEAERLVCEGRLTRQQAGCVDAVRLKELLMSPLFDRVLSSKHVMREEQFFVSMNAGDIFDGYSDIGDGCRIIVQGAVDLAFEENGRLVIVDYKTDRVGSAESLARHYGKQLRLYAGALTQSKGMPVGELVICSVFLNKFISVSPQGDISNQ